MTWTLHITGDAERAITGLPIEHQELIYDQIDIALINPYEYVAPSYLDLRVIHVPHLRWGTFRLIRLVFYPDMPTATLYLIDAVDATDSED